jgi:hypothetical protein
MNKNKQSMELEKAKKDFLKAQSKVEQATIQFARMILKQFNISGSKGR